MCPIGLALVLTSAHTAMCTGGIPLRGTSAYGVRLYQNGSSLVMHHDKVRSDLHKHSNNK